MLLERGAKILACHRRLFPEDSARYFFGVVDAYSDGIAKVSGFTWTRDASEGFQRKSDRRTKLIAIGSGNVIVYELPPEVDVEAIRVGQPGGRAVVATDGAKFRMDLAERH